MESDRWRYHPEFRINITVNGNAPTAGIRIKPSDTIEQVKANYHVHFSTSPGRIVCHVRQRHNGVTWVPSIPLNTPVVFSFLLEFTQELSVSNFLFYSQGTGDFGRRIFYANNLSAAGAIDSTLNANTVRLTPGANVALTDRGSISAGIISKTIAPGTFNQFRIGKIISGVPQSFTTNQPIPATQTSISTDLTLQRKGSYVLRLDGGAPVEEKVFIDPQASANNASGVIEIFRNTWHVPVEPRNYNINFTTI